MKTQISINRIVAYIFLIAFAVFGAYVASVTYEYKVVTRGILSIALWFFAFSSAYRSNDKSAKFLLQFPGNIKYFIYIFNIGLILFWALGFIVEMILFITK